MNAVKPRPSFQCSAHHKRGKAVCAHGFVMRANRIDDAVLRPLGGDVLRPAVVEAVIEGAVQAPAPEAVVPTLLWRHAASAVGPAAICWSA